MSDNKVNMALDDIIKMNKQQKKGKAPSNNARGKQQSRNVRKAPARKGAAAAKKGAAATSLSSVQTKKLVQKLVKKALKTRMAAAQRTTAPVRRGGVRARGISGRPTLARVNIRSRAIQRRAIVQPTTIVRENFVQPPTVVYQDEYVATAPRRRTVPVVRRRVVAPILTQQVFTSRRGNARGGRVRIAGGALVPANNFGNQRTAVRRVVIAQQAPRVQQVQQRIQQRVQPRVQQRVQPRVQQRVQQRTIRRRAPQQRVEYVEAVPQIVRGNGGARFRKNERFRSAIGGGNRGYARQAVDRFEPVTSFINSGSVVRRGRGFTNNY